LIVLTRPAPVARRGLAPDRSLAGSAATQHGAAAPRPLAPHAL